MTASEKFKKMEKTAQLMEEMGIDSGMFFEWLSITIREQEAEEALLEKLKYKISDVTHKNKLRNNAEWYYQLFLMYKGRSTEY